MAVASMGTGQWTFAPFAGLLMESGNPQKEAGGGSVAGGTIDVLAGGVGVLGQSATFLGRPWQPASAPKINASMVVPRIHPALWALVWPSMFRIPLDGFGYLGDQHLRAVRSAVERGWRCLFGSFLDWILSSP